MAKKYIDAEKLIALLEQRKKQLARWTWTDKEYANHRIDEIDCILDVDINSLQQEQQEIDFSFEDWKTFRREAAKDILCAMIHHQNSTDPIEVSIAIEIADELIKQLKEEKK